MYAYILSLILAAIILISPHSAGDIDISTATPDINMDATNTNTVSFDTKDADIRDILSKLARDNGINLIMDDSIQGRLTISLSNLPPLDAIGLILHTNGFTVEVVGDSVVAATPEELRNILPPVSKIIPLQYALAAELKESLSGMVNGQVSIQTDSRTNFLILTGTTSGINAMERAIELLDVEVSSEPPAITSIKVFPLKHVQASVVQTLVSELCSPVGKIQVDEGSNSLIISDKIDTIEQLADVIKQLDIPSVADDIENEIKSELYTRIFRLNYIDANALKEAIQDMLTPEGHIQAIVRQKKSIVPAKAVSMGITTGDQSATALRQDPSRLSVGEKWSDILIITDTADVIESMGNLIGELDTKAPQVMIEAKMVEINLDEVSDIGIDWQIKHAPSKTTPRVNIPTDKTTGLNLQIGTLSTQHFEDILVKIQALETDGHAKLVSNPSIISLDNELAQIIVADRIPIPTTYETDFSATTSYEFINVGIILTVIPHITDDGYILMDAMPEVNSIKEWTTGDNPQPIISSRMAHARVRVKDGQTFVIGGMIRDQQHEKETRVPVLSSIPFLGRLFRSKGVDNSKTDLMVFITPRVCNDDFEK